MIKDSPYARWMGTDNDLCKPVIPGSAIEPLLTEVTIRVFQLQGPGPRPKTMLDLEQLQVVDYAAFEQVSGAQKTAMASLLAAEPIRPEEMIFLALKSLFQFAWPEPTSAGDIEYAALYHAALHNVLLKTALGHAKDFSTPDALLPYWGRLAFLRVMADLPPDNIERFGLNRVACMMLKRAKFNATTFALEDDAVIGINYALQPILKHLNTYLLHFYSSKDMAGPKRLWRAWRGIVPTVLHFWSDITATKLTEQPSFLYSEETAILAHNLTVDQLDFIVMHELGHVALDHPKRLQAEGRKGYDVKPVRHEFEYSADAFALGLMRSRFMWRARSVSLQEIEENEEPDTKTITGALHDYQRGLGSVYLLFTYMDFIQRAGELLRDRQDGSLRIRTEMDSHPRPADRLTRLELMNVGEYLYTSPLQRYASEFLQSVLDYAGSLDDAELMESVTAVIG